ncbi:MAG TPA: ROK family protein [Terriglobia bacterium]|nr:ROK family protein [Terriglobia bacterium]
MHYIGIDIGGTNIKAARIDALGAVVESTKAPTPANDLSDLITAIQHLVSSLQAHGAVAAVGVGIPGLRNVGTGVIQTSPHIPCIRNVNLEEKLQQRLGIPVITENDANAGAYGEWRCGAGKGLQHLAYITLGTGLGCGLILSEDLFRGASGYAGELGHTVLEPGGRLCDCGATGCIETRVSGPGIVQTAREHGVAGDISSAGAIHDAALQGNAEARAVFEETGRYLGMVCANLINLLNPQAIVVGGGVMASGDLLLGAAREEVRRRAFPASAQDCPIVQSLLWPDAGTIGAAMLARDNS